MAILNFFIGDSTLLRFDSFFASRCGISGDLRPAIMGVVRNLVGNGPNTVSQSTVANTELSESFGPHRVPGRAQ